MKLGSEYCLLPVLLLMLSATLEWSEASHRRSLKTHMPGVSRSRTHRAAYVRQGRDSRNNLFPSSEDNVNDVPVVTVFGQTGTTNVLKCRVPDIENITVSWYKKPTLKTPDARLIARGEKIDGNDKRYLTNSSGRDYSLVIHYAQMQDAGFYETRINNNSTPTCLFKLDLIESVAEIVGVKYRIVKPGAPLRLSCILHNSREEPTYIFWYHWDRVINYDLEWAAAVRTGRTESELIFPRAELKHAGNYSCVPSNARQDTVFVSITSTPGEIPSAMQQGSHICTNSIVWSLLSTMLIRLLTWHQCNCHSHCIR